MNDFGLAKNCTMNCNGGTEVKDNWIGMQEDLEQCWWEDDQCSRVGHSGVVRIVLRPDGSGPMGQYDRIHVFNENGRKLVFPAHFVQGWSIKGEQE